MSDETPHPLRGKAVPALLIALILAAVLTIALVLTLPGRTPSPSPSPSPAVATVTSTALQDGTAQGELRKESVPLTRTPEADSPDADITVHADRTGQTVAGFGAALTHSSAGLIAGMPDDARADLIEELFAPDGPVRLSVLRIPIGASDFVDGEPFTFDDLPPGETDWELSRFSIDRDREAMLPVLREILQVNPGIRVMASPWSPPAWLKTTGSLEGGRLLDEDRAYETYAAYFVRFIEEYRDAGVEITELTVQNEPQYRHPHGYPGTDMPVWQQAKLIERLGSALEAAGLGTRIFGYDHNWELHPGDAATTPQGEDPAYEYPADLLRTSAAPWIDGIAYHCYYGDASRQQRLWEQFRDIEIWVTECSGSRGAGDSDEKAFADTFAWQSERMLVNALRYRASAVITFNLALDERHGPHHGGCETCSGVVTIADDGSLTRNAEYYVLAQAGRAVPPGSVHLESTSADELVQTAFRTPDGGAVVLVWHGGDAPRIVRVTDGKVAMSAELPPRSLSTVRWPRD